MKMDGLGNNPLIINQTQTNFSSVRPSSFRHVSTLQSVLVTNDDYDVYWRVLCYHARQSGVDGPPSPGKGLTRLVFLVSGTPLQKLRHKISGDVGPHPTSCE